MSNDRTSVLVFSKNHTCEIGGNTAVYTPLLQRCITMECYVYMAKIHLFKTQSFLPLFKGIDRHTIYTVHGKYSDLLINKRVVHSSYKTYYEGQFLY